MISRADIGQRVCNRAGNVGIIADPMSDYEDPGAPPPQRRPRTVAFLRPERGGGRWWLVSPAEVSRV